MKDGIMGLTNNNLFCYMNACLQCFLAIPEMRDYYMNDKYKLVDEQVRTIEDTK